MTSIGSIPEIPGAPTVTLSTSPIETFSDGDGGTIEYTIVNEFEGTILNFNFEVKGEIPEAGLNVNVANIEAIIPEYSYLSQLYLTQAVTTGTDRPVFDTANDAFSLI